MSAMQAMTSVTTSAASAMEMMMAMAVQSFSANVFLGSGDAVDACVHCLSLSRLMSSSMRARAESG